MAELPGWAIRRCADCGELFLPGFGSVWSSRTPDQWTHGGLRHCRALAEYLGRPDAMALQVVMSHQAITEADGILLRFTSEATDEQWDDETARAVLGAHASLRGGYEAIHALGRPPISPQQEEHGGR